MEFSIISFPFEQIGWLLRQLSLSGASGNVIAIVIYVLLCISPCVVGVVLLRKKKIHIVDLGLPVLSIALFIMMYYMINPGLFDIAIPEFGPILFGTTFYSLLVGYLTLRFVRSLKKAKMSFLQRGIQVLLIGMELVYLWTVGCELLLGVPMCMENLSQGLLVNGVYCGVRSLVNTLPYLLEMVLFLIVLGAIKVVMKDTYSDKAVKCVKRIADWCITALATMAIVNALFNVGQLLLRNELLDINVSANIPIFSILRFMAVLVFAKFVESNQKLKRENEMFI